MKIFKKSFSFKTLKLYFLILFLLFIYAFFCANSYAKKTSIDIAKNVFRLHVIANSDSKEDQNLKYLVRDGLLDYMNSISKNCSSKNDVIKIAKQHENNFKDIALNIVKENGYNYDVNIQIGDFDFPTKTYGDISLPSGSYDALKIEIGNASGKNWWCVMFPPLCFIDISSGVIPNESKEYLKDNMSEEDYALISNNSNSELKFKFKLLEFFADNKLLSKKK